MPGKIRHGAPGAYKTSAAAREDLVLAVWSGRPVVTNVRGLSDEARVREAVLRHPPLSRGKSFLRLLRRLFRRPLDRGRVDEFSLTFVDTSTAEGRERMARWWHWVPQNSFIIFDEAQSIWPKALTARQIANLDLPDEENPGFDSGELRPSTLALAFEQHRHGGFDFVACCPNIANLRTEVRSVCEAAYLHINLATRGARGWYLELYHDPNNSAASESHIYDRNWRRIPGWVFDLYESTATGQTRDTWLGFSLFAQPKLLGMLALSAFAWYWVATSEPPEAFVRAGILPGPEDRGESIPDRFPDPGNGSRSVASPSGRLPDNAGPRFSGGEVGGGPLGGYTLTLTGKSSVRYTNHEYALDVGRDSYKLTDRELLAMGYQVIGLTDCLVKLSWEGSISYVVGCQPPQETQYADIGGSIQEGGTQLAASVTPDKGANRK